jgi:hypothetical protein
VDRAVQSTDETPPSPTAGEATADRPDSATDPWTTVAELADDRQRPAVARVTATGWPGATPPVSPEDLFTSAQRHAARGFGHGRTTIVRTRHCSSLSCSSTWRRRPTSSGSTRRLVLKKNFDFLTLLRLAGAGKKYADRFELVLQARDGVAHVGTHGGAADEVTELLVCGATEILLPMNRSLEESIADWTMPARALLDEHATKVHRVVQLRLSRMRDAFAQRFTGLTVMNAARSWALDVHPSSAHDDK